MSARPIALPLYAHRADPPEPYRAAYQMGRAVALGVLSLADARTAIALSIARRFADAPDPHNPAHFTGIAAELLVPSGLRTRATWFLRDSLAHWRRQRGRIARDIEAAARPLFGQLAGAEILARVGAINNQAGRPLAAHEIRDQLNDLARQHLKQRRGAHAR